MSASIFLTTTFVNVLRKRNLHPTLSHEKTLPSRMGGHVSYANHSALHHLRVPTPQPLLLSQRCDEILTSPKLFFRLQDCGIIDVGELAEIGTWLHGFGHLDNDIFWRSFLARREAITLSHAKEIKIHALNQYVLAKITIPASSIDKR